MVFANSLWIIDLDKHHSKTFIKIFSQTGVDFSCILIQNWLILLEVMLILLHFGSQDIIMGSYQNYANVPGLVHRKNRKCNTHETSKNIFPCSVLLYLRNILVFKRNLWGSHCFTLSCGILHTGCMHAELFSKNLNNVVAMSVVTNFYNFWLKSLFKSKHIGKNWLSL